MTEFCSRTSGRPGALTLTMSDQLPNVTWQRDDGQSGPQLAALVTLPRNQGATLQLAGPGRLVAR
jgi:hypothetical protein